MNKVYGTMSIGMLITFAAYRASGPVGHHRPLRRVAQLNQDKYLTQLGYALYASPLKWVVMLHPWRCSALAP